MKTIQKIIALFFAILLFIRVGDNEKGRVAETYQYSEEKPSLVSADPVPVLFAIHHQQRNGTNFLEESVRTHTAGNQQDSDCHHSCVESGLRRRSAIVLHFTKAPEYERTVKKIIFPFHSHW